MTMEHPPFEDVFPIENADFPAIVMLVDSGVYFFFKRKEFPQFFLVRVVAKLRKNPPPYHQEL